MTRNLPNYGTKKVTRNTTVNDNNRAKRDDNTRHISSSIATGVDDWLITGPEWDKPMRNIFHNSLPNSLELKLCNHSANTAEEQFESVRRYFIGEKEDLQTAVTGLTGVRNPLIVKVQEVRRSGKLAKAHSVWRYGKPTFPWRVGKRQTNQ